MEKLNFVFVGFLLAAIILCLLALNIRRRRSKKAIEAIPQQIQQQAPIEQLKPVSIQETQQAPQEAVLTEVPSFAGPSLQNIDELIQAGFKFLEDGLYEQAIKSFQEGLSMTNDSKISTQLYLELAKIHNLLSDREAALKYLDSALEFCRKGKNGATEKEILRIKEIIMSNR